MRTFLGVWTAVWLTFTAFGVVVPAIPRLTSSPALVGAAFAATAVVALGARPYGGQLALRWGPRRVLAAGAAVAAVAGGIYLFPLGTPGLLAARVATGAAEALVMTAGSVWTVALAPQHRRGQVVGWYGLAMWGGLAAGPALGELLHRAGAAQQLVWVVAAALPTMALLVLACLPPGERSAEPVPLKLVPPAAVLPGLALAAGGFGFASVTSFGALAMTARGIPNGAVLLSLFGAAYVVVRLLAGRLPDRFGPVPIVVASAVLEASGLLLIAVAPAWWVAAIGAAVAGGGFTLLYPALALIALDAAPAAERGAALGAVSSFLDLSVGIAGLVGGIVAGVSYPAVFGLAAALALASIAATRTMRRAAPAAH